MKLALNFLISALAFFLVSLMFSLLYSPQVQAQAQPTSTITPSWDFQKLPTLKVVTSTPKPSPTPGIEPTKPSFLGLTGQIACYNCAPFSAKVKVSIYDPMDYNPEYPKLNCWDYHDNYCYSPMRSGLPWKAFYGIAVACPFEWPYGTWVDIEGIGRFICLDRGGGINCTDGVCNVDILGHNNNQWYLGAIFDAILWVPLNPGR